MARNLVVLLAFVAEGCSGCKSTGEWGAWSKCTQPCGVGSTRRDREVSKEDDCPHSMEVMTCNEWPCETKPQTQGYHEDPAKKLKEDQSTVSELDAQFAQQQDQLVGELQAEKSLLNKDPDDPDSIKALAMNAIREQKQVEGMTTAMGDIKELNNQEVFYPMEYQAASKRTLRGLTLTHHKGN